MQDNIIINKSEIISRCLLRVKEEYLNAGKHFLTDYSKQDAAILNLERAIQAAIDMAAHVVRTKSLAVPKESKDLFVALHQNKFISNPIFEAMCGMVGFRNIAVHEYQKLDMGIVVSIIKKHLVDIENFVKEILKAK